MIYADPGEITLNFSQHFSLKTFCEEEVEANETPEFEDGKRVILHSYFRVPWATTEAENHW